MCAPKSLKSTSSPWSTQTQGTLHGTRVNPPQSLLPGASAPLSTPGTKLLYHPLPVIIPSKHCWLMAPLPVVPLPQAPTQLWCQRLSLASPAAVFYLQTQSSSALQLLH